MTFIDNAIYVWGKALCYPEVGSARENMEELNFQCDIVLSMRAECGGVCDPTECLGSISPAMCLGPVSLAWIVAAEDRVAPGGRTPGVGLWCEKPI